MYIIFINKYVITSLEVWELLLTFGPQGKFIFFFLEKFCLKDTTGKTRSGGPVAHAAGLRDPS